MANEVCLSCTDHCRGLITTGLISLHHNIRVLLKFLLSAPQIRFQGDEKVRDVEQTRGFTTVSEKQDKSQHSFSQKLRVTRSNSWFRPSKLKTKHKSCKQRIQFVAGYMT